MINKKDCIRLLELIATYMEIKGENSFKISAYRKAAQALEVDVRPLEQLDDLTKIANIGKGTAQVIDEYRTTGQCGVLDELKQQVPETLLPLLKLPSLGGKKIAKLYQELNITNRAELQAACEAGRVQALAGFGAKTEAKILAALLEQNDQPERLPLYFMLKVADKIEASLAAMPQLQRWSRAGSLRRMRETSKDLDYIMSTEEVDVVRAQLISLPNVKTIIANGETKVSVVIEDEYDVSVDFRLVKDEEFVTTLHHFTGSKDHNVKLRQIAKERGEKISEYGVTNVETNEVTTFATEEAFFAHFDLPFIPPALREDGQEVERHEELPQLISVAQMQGDLHMHTTWSDGAHSIEQMIEACVAKGYRYMAITDHSHYLKVAHGLTPERVLAQREELYALQEKYPMIQLFSGTEMDILPDGTLDFSDEVLQQLDFVIASIHSSFSQKRDVIHARLETALTNRYVSMIAHPTGRVIGKRDGYDVDVEWLMKRAKETNTILEINANPQRLDLMAEHVKRAGEIGCYIAINTDAHHIGMLDDMQYGVATAMKGWLKADYVVNSWPLERLQNLIHQQRNGG